MWRPWKMCEVCLWLCLHTVLAQWMSAFCFTQCLKQLNQGCFNPTVSSPSSFKARSLFQPGPYWWCSIFHSFRRRRECKRHCQPRTEMSLSSHRGRKTGKGSDLFCCNQGQTGGQCKVFLNVYFCYLKLVYRWKSFSIYWELFELRWSPASLSRGGTYLLLLPLLLFFFWLAERDLGPLKMSIWRRRPLINPVKTRNVNSFGY